MQHLKDLVISRVKDGTRRNVWTAADFLDLGSLSAVDKALQRLVARGDLRRIGRGRYDKPGFNQLTKQATGLSQGDRCDRQA